MKKTLIIVEGMDNTGKDTLISGIKENVKGYNTIIEEHFTGPSSKDSNVAFIEQINQFIKYVNRIIYNNDLTIWNRSHIGEYVYGQIYRNIDKKIIIKLINLIDELLLSLDIDIIYVQLICTSNELMIKNEDGKSLSKSIKDKEKYINAINNERNLFMDAYNVVSDKFKKIMIVVNDGDEFISKKEILDKVIRKIYE